MFTRAESLVSFSALGALFRALRPHQWIENAVVLAALSFAGKFTELESVLRSLAASGSVYLLNDLLDVRADQEHPLKSRRPIASGQLLPPLASAVSRAPGRLFHCRHLEPVAKVDLGPASLPIATKRAAWTPRPEAPIHAKWGHSAMLNNTRLSREPLFISGWFGPRPAQLRFGQAPCAITRATWPLRCLLVGRNTVSSR